jgi:hypothetical protein
MDMKLSSRFLAVLAGTLVIVWLTATGPVAAHEGTAATAPTSPAPAAVPGSDAGSADVLPGVAEYVPQLSAAMSEGDRWSSLSVIVAAAGVLAAVAVAPRRSKGGVAESRGRLHVAGALALLFAGVAHCALAPSHWNEGWHLGAFFAASGLLLVGQGALLWLRPSVAAYRSVLLSTGAMIVLYVAARQVALPLVDHRDPYLLTDIPVKAA